MLAFTSLFDRRALPLATASALLLSGFTVSFSCGDDPVQLEFTDASQGCNTTEGRLDQPIARGARLDITVAAPGQDVVVSDVEVDDPAVLSAQPAENMVSVEARAVGQTRLRVETTAGASGNINLSVAEPARATIVPDSMTVWNLDTTLTERHPEATAALVAGGFALLPDGELHLGVQLFDASDAALIGYGVAGWTASPDGVSLTPVDSRHDDIRVAAEGETGEVTLTTIAGGAQVILLLPEQAAATLDIYSPETGAIGGPIELAVGEVRTIVLVAFDGDGRLLLGNGPTGFQATLVATGSTPAATLVDPPWATGDLALDDAARATLEAARVVSVSGVAPGQATLHLETTGVALDLELSVSE